MYAIQSDIPPVLNDSNAPASGTHVVLFSELYRNTLALWPKTISIADGHARGNRRYEFQQLEAVHEAIQMRIGKQQKWQAMMSSCIHAASHDFSKYLAMAGVDELNLHSVPIEDIAQQITSHLEREWDAAEASRFVNNTDEMRTVIQAERAVA